MSGTIDELISRIKDIPTSEILAHYIHVVKKGTQTLAVCPFHDDSNPSLNINDQRGMWFCFVDNLGGDSIKFVRLYRNLEFMDALRDICDKLGWNFDDYHQKKKASPKIEMGKKVLTNTMKLYRKVAETSGKEVFQDFLQKRGLSEETAKTYQLGFSPNTGVLFGYLSSIKDEKERNFALQTAEELGLIKKSSYGDKSHYDTFRERIMFPIWDHFGQVIGFTSRSIRDDQKPKYLNSIDSFLFNKKNLLYGLHLAKTVMRERDYAIIVEGNMDQIALYKNGFENSVAIMGVALGEQSLVKLLSTTKNIVLSLDNDQPGWKAGTRINAQLMEKGVTAKFLDLGEYKDPDDFLCAEGHDALAKRIEEARPFIDIQIERTFPAKIPELAERKLDILRDVFEIVSPLKEALSATERIILYAKRLGLQSDSQAILSNYKDYLNNSLPKFKKATPPAAVHNTPSISDDEAYHMGMMEASEAPPYHEDYDGFSEAEHRVELKRELSSVESRLLQNLIQYPDLLFREETTELLDFVGNNEVKGYILRLRELMYEIEESEYVSVIQALLDDQEYSAELTAVIGGALYKYQESNLDEKVTLKMIVDIKKNLQVEQLKAEKKTIKLKIKEAQTQQEMHALLTQLTKVDKQLLAVNRT